MKGGLHVDSWSLTQTAVTQIVRQTLCLDTKVRIDRCRQISCEVPVGTRMLLNRNNVNNFEIIRELLFGTPTIENHFHLRYRTPIILLLLSGIYNP